MSQLLYKAALKTAGDQIIYACSYNGCVFYVYWLEQGCIRHVEINKGKKALDCIKPKNDALAEIEYDEFEDKSEVTHPLNEALLAQVVE